ncbi:DUF4185 domain-containing protein [Nonomuraea sp. NPDC050394]|uniref:DUF4185 domain-containing protein n=1 Tax=Nonomuraea sp. NPDC050394 TaxID=3364363 RepID=UPI0037BCD909
MKRLRLVLVPLLLALLLPQQAMAAEANCAPEFRGSSINPRLTSLFSNYGNDNSRLDDWTGADGTYSVRLPSGKELWVFSDTFLGQVNPDGSRPPVVEEGGTTVFLNNTFALEREGRLRTIYGGRPGKPAAVMPPRDKKHWYWAGDVTLAGGMVEVTYQEYERFGTGAWDWKWHRNVVARFPQGRMERPVSVHDLPSGNGVAWASGILKDGRHTYVYGVEDKGATKYMHLARVRGESLLGRWEFRTASGTWSPSEKDSARMMEGVANEYSVTKVGDGYVLITHDTTEALSAKIVAYSSCSPTGPFTGKQVLYTTPETNGNIFTYNAHAHPGVAGDGLVVSYNVNSFVNTDHYRDVSIYRPRFIDVRFG